MLKKIVHKEFDKLGELTDGFKRDIVYENGLKKSELTYDLEGNEIHQTEFIYQDKLVHQIKEIGFQELMFTKKFEYNSDGTVIHEILENETGEIEFELQFIEEENIILERQYGETTIKKLNDKGKIYEELESDNTITKYHYEGDNLVRIQIFEEGELMLDESYYFDEHGNEIGSSGKDLETGVEVVIKRKFSDFNKLLLEENFDNGKLSFRKTQTYDEQQRMVKEQVETIEMGDISVTEYFYE